MPPAAWPASRPSRIIVHAEASLSRIERELETRVERRLASARGVSVGIAGSVNYTVDRGPFALSVAEGALWVTTEARADVEVCSRGRCYASCKPVAVVRARVPLKLSLEYRFAPSRVSATFTRGCKVRALSGFLTIDVTRQLETEMAPVLRRVERDIDRRLPDLRPEVMPLWAELGKPRSLPLLGCLVLQPSGIVQGPSQGTRETLRLRFALLAAPELRPRCDDMPAGSLPLPPLVHEATLPDEDEVMLGLVSPLTDLAGAFESSEPVDFGGALVGVERATVAPSGTAIDADLSLQGDVCGELSLRASPTWTSDGRALTLVTPVLGARESERIAAASLDPGSLARAMGGALRLGLPLDTERLEDALPALASSLSDDSVDVIATVSAVRPAEAAARGEDLVAWLGIRGQLRLRQR
jgi:hypothetical protein